MVIAIRQYCQLCGEPAEYFEGGLHKYCADLENIRASCCIIEPSDGEGVTRMTRPRDGLYAWVTWLSKLMSGEVQCHWGAWFKTHYTDYRTQPIDAQLASWTVDHNQYLTELINERKALGEITYKEDQNKFRVKRASGLTIAGKPDLITYNKTTEQYMVYDVKTGNQRQSDIIQVMLYCYCLPYASPIYKGKTLDGCVVYKTDRVEVPSRMVDDAFTKRLITVGFPGLEMGRLLVHSIVAHELGHCLYVERKLESRLLRFVKPDEQRLDALVREWAETAPGGQRTLSEYVSEVEIRSLLTRQINRLAKLWVKELTCDAIGYCLFGPAYLFAALDFLTIAYAFDDDLHTHPPNRMRFRLLYEMLDKDTEFLNILEPQVKSFLDSWRSVTQSQDSQFTNPITDLTGSALLNIYDRIINTATSAVGSAGPYSASENATELQRLVKRVEVLIPPNELIEAGGSREVKFQSIINAGWLVYLAGLKTIQEKFNFEPWECKKKFNENIARAVELNEIQRRWGEIQ